MPYPFLQKHSEKQYLDLETNYLNLFNALSSLLTITEGEDLNSDSQRLSHFNALCTRINEIVARFSKVTEQVQTSKFKGDSATTSSKSDPASVILLWVDQEERGLIVEALENYALMLDDYKVSDNFTKLANEIKEGKHEESE
tara:strand:- start:5096 stop:5521 length:426 start_codon:yes stop_codon:yes gene_type:complete